MAQYSQTADSTDETGAFCLNPFPLMFVRNFIGDELEFVPIVASVNPQ